MVAISADHPSAQKITASIPGEERISGDSVKPRLDTGWLWDGMDFSLTGLQIVSNQFAAIFAWAHRIKRTVAGKDNVRKFVAEAWRELRQGLDTVSFYEFDGGAQSLFKRVVNRFLEC